MITNLRVDLFEALLGSARRDDAQTLRQNFIETLRLVNAVSPLHESVRRDQLACVYVAR